jgi:4-carboxymuconolactone decarboxylase
MPRLAPLTPPWSADTLAALARWMPPAAGVEPLALFRTLLRHPPLADAMLPLGRHQLSGRAALPRRVRELVILRTCARLGCEYEWGVHAAAFGAMVGLEPADVAATAAPGVAPSWTGTDALAIRLVDALVDGADVPDDLWSGLAAAFDEAQLLELLVLCGWYHVIAFVARGTRLALEPWAARFPDGGDGH